MNNRSASTIYGFVFIALASLLVFIGCNDGDNPVNPCPDPNNIDCLEKDGRLYGLWVTPTCDAKQDTILVSRPANLRTKTNACGTCNNGNELAFDNEWIWDQLEENSKIKLTSEIARQCGIVIENPQVSETEVDYSISANGDTLFWGINREIYVKTN
ncbi:hypothetical protein G3570_02455 [Balneolaceae bacterium YR4-1]|uniref:Lipoprotein n=1 Tax=Halalkalibaculum roseum TaxID=2709311 RepID=A0A6M1STQ5_9BACT|nr:hypothetical protein [Halalkalibaculum roseum]NGP75478.1 hypothetical protein [Halalkalibaculum roseum]